MGGRRKGKSGGMKKKNEIVGRGMGGKEERIKSPVLVLNQEGSTW